MRLAKTNWMLALLTGVSLVAAGNVAANNLSHFQTIANTDMVAAGVGGLRSHSTTGTITSGTIMLPAFSGSVKKAYLYWHGPTNSTDINANASITVNGTVVVGTNIGFSYDNHRLLLRQQLGLCQQPSLSSGCDFADYCRHLQLWTNRFRFRS